MQRYNSIDFFRFIAAFFILLVHTDHGILDIEYVNNIRISARWAVPFFFICSGFFLGKKIQKDKQFDFSIIAKSLVKLISIFIIASVIYIPANIILNYYYFGVQTLLTGTFIHLWFIGSLIFGNIFIWYAYTINKQHLLPYISVFIIFAALLSDSYDNLLGFNLDYSLFRFSLSIPFMQIGIFFNKKEKTITKINFLILICFLFLGFILQYFEASFFSKYFNYDKILHEFLLGTFIMVIPLFVITIKLKINNNKISKLGLRYSLWIYLYHPFIYILLNKVNMNIFSSTTFKIIQCYNPILCFLLSIIIVILLDKYTNKVFKLTNGIIY